MAAFFHHETIRKYTLGLLSTFNGIEVQKLKSDGITKLSQLVPINFSSREKATILSEHETSEILNGNFNIVPRIALVFNSMTKASERTTSKFNKINKQMKDVGGVSFASYQFNAVPYDFAYSLIIVADGMTEASMIAEQIAAYFNPTYNLKINEIPLQVEPATIPILLNDISFEQQEYDEFSSNLVTIQVELTVKGNIYPPIRDQHLIEQIEIFYNLQTQDEYDRVSKMKWERQLDNTFNSTFHSFIDSDGQFGNVMPVISALVGPSTVVANGVYNYVCSFIDEDSKFSEITFLYNIITTGGILPADIGTLTIDKDKVRLNVGATTPAQFQIQVIIIDAHGNSSVAFYKTIN